MEASWTFFFPVEKPVGELLRFVGMGQRQTCLSLGFDLTLPRLAWEGEAQVCHSLPITLLPFHSQRSGLGGVR